MQFPIRCLTLREFVPDFGGLLTLNAPGACGNRTPTLDGDAVAAVGAFRGWQTSTDLARTFALIGFAALSGNGQLALIKFG